MWEPPARIADTNVSTLRPGFAPPTRPPNRTVLIHQTLQPQPIHQRPRHQQTRVGYQPLIIENHPIPVDIVRYSTHRKCLQTLDQQPFLLQLLSQIRGTFHVYPPPTPKLLSVDPGLVGGGFQRFLQSMSLMVMISVMARASCASRWWGRRSVLRRSCP